jgi:hypothetical protein
VKITMLRMELVAAVNSVRLARKIKGALKIPLVGTRYSTDSSAVLGMLRTESRKFTEFVGGEGERGESKQQHRSLACWELQSRGPLNTIKRKTPGLCPWFRIPRGHGMDEGVYRLLPLQEIVSTPISTHSFHRGKWCTHRGWLLCAFQDIACGFQQQQLVAASKQLAAWSFKGVQEWAGKNGIEWHLVPTGGQHFNRQAERMIGILKKQIWRSFEGRKYTHEETCRLPQEATQVVNSRPLTAGPWAEGNPLSPEDLMMGKVRAGMPIAQFETGQQLVKRFKVVQKAKEEFW